VALVAAHLIALHEVGSNNPDGVEIKKNKDPVTHIPLDGIPFHPYYTVKDVLGVVVFLIVFSAVVFLVPEMGGYFLEHPNFDPADPLKTPPHIAPVWYFTPFYAILRAIPSFAGTQVWGVLGMGGAVVLIAFLPWLDKSPVKSIRYRSTKFKVMVTLFIVAFIGLGILGAMPSTNVRTVIAQIFSVMYFGFFLGMPFFTKNDVGSVATPARVTDNTGGRQVLFFVLMALAIGGATLFAKMV
jgi:ubiquinol-cytochrome c reductase cytochrome b subunit